MDKPFLNHFPPFQKKLELDKKTATYIFARLLSKQTPEHILERLEYKLKKLPGTINACNSRHNKYPTPERQQTLANLISAGKKYESIISYMKSLPDYSVLKLGGAD